MLCAPPKPTTKASSSKMSSTRRASTPSTLGLKRELNLRLAASVMDDFAVDDYGDVPLRSKKLHHFRAFPRHFRPSRLGLRILFDPTVARAIKLKIHLSQSLLRRPPHGVYGLAHLNFFRPPHQYCPPHNDERVLQPGGIVGLSHDRNPNP